MERTIVTVTLEDREDGGLLVYSDELPGLILSGSNQHAVCECIAPAIQALFEHKGYSVSVYSETPIKDVLKLASPRNVDMHVQRFIVEYKLAA
jgi:hypothetical protein